MCQGGVFFPAWLYMAALVPEGQVNPRTQLTHWKMEGRCVTMNLPLSTA